MKKSDLKAGQKMVCGDDKEFIYFPNNKGYELISFNGGSDSIATLSENLKDTETHNSRYDVVKVFECKDWTIAYIFEDPKKVVWTQIWERDEENIKEVTMEDVECEFGCKVKIVNKI